MEKRGVKKDSKYLMGLDGFGAQPIRGENKGVYQLVHDCFLVKESCTPEVR